jgi:hypothetical protein
MKLAANLSISAVLLLSLLHTTSAEPRCYSGEELDSEVMRARMNGQCEGYLSGLYNRLQTKATCVTIGNKKLELSVRNGLNNLRNLTPQQCKDAYNRIIDKCKHDNNSDFGYDCPGGEDYLVSTNWGFM